MKNKTPYELRYSRRVKRLRLEVVPGEVRVVAPFGLAVSVIDKFVQSKEKWLAGKLSAFEAVNSALLPVEYSNSSTLTVLGRSVVPRNYISQPEDKEAAVIEWLDQQLMTFLDETLKKYMQTGFVPTRVRLGNARTRWGSCNSRGVIMINRRLVHAPPDVVEYVLVHEIVHLRHRNHSSQFWNTLRVLLGDVEPQKKWLRLQGSFLL